MESVLLKDIENLLVMDFDGVLNGERRNPLTYFSRLEKENVEVFNNLLEELNAGFVVSSAWRYLVHGGSMTFEGFRNLLYSHCINAHRLVGITRKDTEVRGFDRTWKPLPNERGSQISDWLTQSGFTGRYLVLDNHDLGIRAAGHPFLQTESKVGLTEAHIPIILEYFETGNLNV